MGNVLPPIGIAAELRPAYDTLPVRRQEQQRSTIERGGLRPALLSLSSQPANVVTTVLV
jgi:hypothetical protein